MKVLRTRSFTKNERDEPTEKSRGASYPPAEPSPPGLVI
jgi:hypothetical protein